MSSARPRIGYWMFNFEPQWEAVSKDVEILREEFGKSYGTRMVTLDLWGERGTTLRGPDKHLPLPYALVGLPWIVRTAHHADLNHLFASPGERFLLPRLASLDNSVLTISKQNPTLRGLERNVESLREFRCVVVETERYADLLLQIGVHEDSIRLIRPGVERRAYRKADDPFTIMFATSPRKNGLVTRGIYLMARVAERLPHVRFRLVWRRNPEQVESLFRRLDLPNVEIVAGFVDDMDALYDSAHAVILPALEPNSLKPCPRSGLDALGHGKPVLVSDQVAMSSVVRRQGCGVVFQPTVPSLCRAIERLVADYDSFQVQAHPTVAAMFSRETFLAQYSSLYDSLLGRHAAEPAHLLEHQIASI